MKDPIIYIFDDEKKLIFVDFLKQVLNFSLLLFTAAFATTTPPMVQYDQYGVPYTSYTPMMTSEGGSAIESSSIESTTPNSPPDLSMYNPTNWVPAPPPASAGTAADPAYQQAYQHQQYYSYYQTPYYNNYAVMMENSTVPSSGMIF